MGQEGWGGRSGWGTHANPWLINVNICQKPLQYYKVINLQLIKIIEKKIKYHLLLWLLLYTTQNLYHFFSDSVWFFLSQKFTRQDLIPAFHSNLDMLLNTQALIVLLYILHICLCVFKMNHHKSTWESFNHQF